MNRKQLEEWLDCFELEFKPLPESSQQAWTYYNIHTRAHALLRDAAPVIRDLLIRAVIDQEAASLAVPVAKLEDDLGQVLCECGSTREEHEKGGGCDAFTLPES